MNNEQKQMDGLWIPLEILNDENLSLQEKFVLAMIKALDKGQGCFASNKYLAKFVGVSADRISKLITNLHKNKYITVEVVGYNTRTIRMNKIELAVEEQEEDIEKEKQPIIWRGHDLRKFDSEALERIKKMFPEVERILNGEVVEDQAPAKDATPVLSVISSEQAIPSALDGLLEEVESEWADCNQVKFA